ncbi:MAG: hypothetical protein DWQ02_05655, partial [Bacteroidetes bacterium]
MDRPPGTTLSEPIIRGFCKNGYYLLIKSFPDHSPGVRKGRIFSHVLIIEKEDYLKIQDITQLVPLLFDKIDKTAKLKPIDLQPQNRSASQGTVSGQIAGAINGMVNHLDFDNTIIWIGEEGYFDWISHIWPNLPDTVKVKTRIGGAFDPKKIDATFLNLKFIPARFEMNWLRTRFKLIGSNCNENMDSQTANILAGNRESSAALQSLIKEFSLEVPEIDDLRVLETIVPTYQDLINIKDLKQLYHFVHYVTQYNPNPQSASSAKKTLVQLITNCIAEANAEEINALVGPDWSGFSKAKSALLDALIKWLEKYLL